MKYILFIFMAIMSIYDLNSQSCCTSSACYVRLDDISGINTDQYQAELQQAACDLVKSFPAEFQEDFKVFDFGFYKHSEKFEGEFPEEFDLAIEQADQLSPYYLLFGKQVDKDGYYTKIWVNVKLPESGIFSCFKATTKEILPLLLQASVEVYYDKVKNIYLEYNKAELAGIQKLKKIVLYGIDCCRIGTETCDLCPDNNEIKSILKQKGFFEIPVTGLTVNPLLDESGVFKQYASVSAIVGGQMIDINGDMKAYLEDIFSAADAVFGSISHYDEAGKNSNPYQVLKIINNAQITNYPAMAAPDDRKNNENTRKDDLRSGEENIFLKADVISVRDLEGKEFIYYREVQKLASGSGKSKIYIAFTNEVGFSNEDRNGISLMLKGFYELIGISKNDIYYYPVGAKMTTSLIVDSDVISIVSKKPKKLKQYILDNLPSRYSNCLAGLDDFIASTSLEHGFADGQNVTIVATDKCLPYIDKFGCGNDMKKVVAFLIFHGNGHNAGHKHESDCDAACFMSSGPVIVGAFGHMVYTCKNFQCTYNCKKTIEEIIIDANTDCEWIVEMMKNKY